MRFAAAGAMLTLSQVLDRALEPLRLNCWIMSELEESSTRVVIDGAVGEIARPARPVTLDDLAGVAPERTDLHVSARASGFHRTVENRVVGETPKDCKAGGPPATA